MAEGHSDWLRPWRRRLPIGVSAVAIVASCETVRESISAAFDGEAAPMGDSEVARHLQSCQDCGAFRSDIPLLARGFSVRSHVSTSAEEDQIVNVLGIPLDSPTLSEAQGRRQGRSTLVRATQWAAGVVPLAYAAPAFALGVFGHAHFPPSHMPTPCTWQLVHMMGAHR